MIQISSLISKDKVIEVAYTDIPEWKIKVAYVAREDLVNIRKECTTIKWDKKTRQRDDVLDDEKFLRMYSAAIVKGWSGLTLKGVSKLLPIKYEIGKDNEEVEFTDENAYTLMTDCPDFDRFIADVIADVAAFNDNKKEINVKNLKNT